MTLEVIERVLMQGKELGTVESIYFEGGEPFLYYPVLVKGVHMAAGMGFTVGVVTNAYWATSPEDAREWLRPLRGFVQDLSISSDLYHEGADGNVRSENARIAADRLGIPTGVISITELGAQNAQEVTGQLLAGENVVMFRGRAAEKLTAQARQWTWDRFTECSYEDLRDPGRVHVDPLGHVHICQGVSIGNLMQVPLKEICGLYDPDSHPIAGPLLAGGPTQLVRQYGLAHAETYADACHLCYDARLRLRTRFTDALVPDQMYGVVNK